MKIIKTLIIGAVLMIGGQAFAQTTPIHFAKGSYCGSFEGDYTDKTFTLFTKANQLIYIDTKDNARDVADIVVIDPKGRKYRADSAEFEFTTKVKGIHKIKVIPYNDHGFANIEFCAY